MAVLKVRDPEDPTKWLDIGGTGYAGPSGGPVPVGGNPGELVLKTGAADFEVGWVKRPRVAGMQMLASVVSHSAGGNNLVEACSVDVTVYPDRWYHIFAGVRCINDAGATIATAHFAAAIGTTNLAQWDEVTTADVTVSNGLWGSWSQDWLHPGSDFTSTIQSLRCRFSVGCTVASRTFYTPRLYVIEM